MRSLLGKINMYVATFQISKQTILLFGCCLFLLSCVKPRLRENDLSADQIKGSVSDATFIFYDLVLVSKKKYDRWPQSKYSFRFNKQGNIVEQKVYLYKDSAFILSEVTNFTDDAEGRPIFTFHDSHPNPFIKISYQTEATETDSFDDMTGAILKKTVSSPLNDTLTIEQQQSPTGKKLGKTIYQTKQGRLVAYKIFNKDGRQEAQYYFKYDTAFRVKSRIYVQHNKVDTLTYSYLNFDQYGNYLVAITHLHRNPYMLEERTLTYFKN